MIYKDRKSFMAALDLALTKLAVPDRADIIDDFGRHFDEGAAAGETEEQVCEKLGDAEEIARQYIIEEDGEAPKVKLEKTGVNFGKPRTRPEPEQQPYTGQQSYTGNQAYSGQQSYTGQQAYTGGQTYTNDQTYTGSQAYTGGQTYTNDQTYTGSQTYSGGQTYTEQQSYSSGQTAGSYYQSGYAASGIVSGLSPDVGKLIALICIDVFVLTWALPTLVGLILSLAGVAVSFVLSGIAMCILSPLSALIDITGIITTGFAPISIFLLGVFMTASGGLLVIAFFAAAKGFINLCIGIINHHASAIVGHNILNKIGKKEEA